MNTILQPSDVICDQLKDEKLADNQPIMIEKNGEVDLEFQVSVNKFSRESWGGKLDFLLSCIGYAVGLGNIWRFPYLCYKNGGGAFLIPYLTFLVLCGMPLLFLEMCFGQFSSLSPIAIWKISPLFKGLGYGMLIISGLVCIYYNVIIAWTLFYLVNSFTGTLPWKTCNNYWNTEHCSLRKNIVNASSSQIAVFNETTNSSDYLNLLSKKVTPSEEFWKYRVLNITSGIEDLGGIRYELFFCLLVAWVCVFCCLIKGVKSSGKVVYVTAVFPYLVLLILCIRGVTLPGALEGIKFYLLPKWHKLLEFNVWTDAAMQIFYSIGASWGALITMSSYNKFHNNVYRDALIVPLMNCGTSIFAGFVIFSIIGFIQNATGAPIKDVVEQGPGLIFVVYPEALSELIISPFWAILFFLMIFTVGLDSQFGMFETVTSAFVDEFPALLKSKKLLITGIICVLEFCIGILCVMRGGVYVLQIMDWYSSTFSLMIISLFECIVIGWIYGVDRFYKDIELMIGFRPCRWWELCWRFITPGIILFIFTASIIKHSPVTYGSEENTYHYPNWAVAIGLCLALVSILPIPICAIVYLCKTPGDNLLQRFKSAIKPTPEWGPYRAESREEWIATLEGELKDRILKGSNRGSNQLLPRVPTGSTEFCASKMTVN